jgi:hypothetical protein
VREAQRIVEGDQMKTKAPRMSEAIALFEQWTGPAYPKIQIAFAAMFMQYGHGKATEKQLEAAWDDIADVTCAVEAARAQKPVSGTATVPGPIPGQVPVGAPPAPAPPALAAAAAKPAPKPAVKAKPKPKRKK